MTTRTATSLLLFLAPAIVAATEAPSGQVQIPLEAYASLMEGRSGVAEAPRFALGPARVRVEVEGDAALAGRVRAELGVELFADGLVAIPLLPPGSAVTSVTVAGAPASVVALGSGLGVAVRGPGVRSVVVEYQVAGGATGRGHTLSIPLPPGVPSVELTALLPGDGLDAVVVPASASRVESRDGTTSIVATVPPVAGAMVSWRSPEGPSHALVKASYEGELAHDTVTFHARLELELFGAGTVMPPLLPQSVTLLGLALDGAEAPVVVADGSYSVPVSGRGRHVAVATFQVPVTREGGAPSVAVPVTRAPVSRFVLTLPGEKELTVTPAASVETRSSEGGTVATVHVPMTDSVTFAWNEAVPEEEGAEGVELRANAAIYHAAHALEGVLTVRAAVDYEITRGETSSISFDVAPDVQVTRLVSAPAAAADWRMSVEPGRGSVLTVFFDQPVSGALHVDVLYDRSIPEGATVPLPLLVAREVARQRGMVALLQGRELALAPVEESGAARVGENQLPASFKDQLGMSVGHTFKYADAPPAMTVTARPPERTAGRYDVTIDSLLSIDEATLAGSASVEVNVKTGQLDALALSLPAGVNLLGLTGPSVRDHVLVAEAGGQRLDVSFTQPMDGQLRLEVAYEMILGEGGKGIPAPVVSVRGAEVGQGRIAVEARAAVEVTAASALELTVLEPSGLPRQLVLRTSNPILLAYEYVHAARAPQLLLDVRRHAAVEVQEAVIEEARYRTLVTRDGLAVTTADLVVRNARKQFLRLKLPAGADVWSATVDGAVEKPAREGEGGEAAILVKIKSDAAGFPVRLVYAIQGAPLGALGTFRASLPRPEILATRSVWELHLPEELRYGAPRTNLDPERKRLRERPQDPRSAARGERPSSDGAQLDIEVPTTSVRLVFEKLYANRGAEEAWVAIPYASPTGVTLGSAASATGALASWSGLLLALRAGGRRARAAWIALGAAGVLLVVLTVALLHASADPAIRVWVGVGAVLLARAGIAAWRARRPLPAQAGT